MVRELTTKRFWRGLRAMVEFCPKNDDFLALFFSQKALKALF